MFLYKITIVQFTPEDPAVRLKYSHRFINNLNDVLDKTFFPIKPGTFGWLFEQAKYETVEQ